MPHFAGRFLEANCSYCGIPRIHFYTWVTLQDNAGWNRTHCLLSKKECHYPSCHSPPHPTHHPKNWNKTHLLRLGSLFTHTLICTLGTCKSQKCKLNFSQIMIKKKKWICFHLLTPVGVLLQRKVLCQIFVLLKGMTRLPRTIRMFKKMYTGKGSPIMSWRHLRQTLLVSIFSYICRHTSRCCGQHHACLTAFPSPDLEKSRYPFLQ